MMKTPVRLDYFALLGVGEDISQDELEARYRDLTDHLASPATPAKLREWALRQRALVDEAYAVLSDPERRAEARWDQRPAAERDNHQRSRAVQHQPTEEEEPVAEPREEPEEKPRRRSTPRQAAGRPEPALHRLLRGGPQPILLGILIGIVVVGAVFVGRYGLPGGGGGDTPEGDDVASFGVALDTERVHQLLAAVEQTPDDPELLFELGETFFQANEWQSAIDWFTQLLAVDPGNIHAMTDVGTANFNLDRPEEASAAWLAVLELDPNDVQAHYNMGFLYSNVEPIDLASARSEWQLVVDLAPDSSLAQTAQVHLDGLPEEGETEVPPP